MARLGRQSQARVHPDKAKNRPPTRSERRPAPSESQRKERRGGDMFHVAALAMPIQSTLSPAMGRTCGRRERGADPGYVPRSLRWKAPRSAGCRKPSRVCGTTRVLVGPNRVRSGLVPTQAVAPMTTGALRKKEEGNVVSVRRNITHALIVKAPNKRPRERGHVLHSVRRPVHVNRH